MWIVCGCAFVCVLQSAINDGGRSLIPAAAAVFSAIFIELLLTWRDYRFSKVKDGSAAASAVILCLMLPNDVHPVYAAIGAIFAVVVVKYSFGGLGANWLNPALGGWLFIRFSWPAVFKNVFESASVVEMASSSDVSKIDSSVTEVMNSSIFSLAGVQLPLGYIDLLFYSGPGLIVDRGLIALLLGTVVIIAIGISRGWIPVAFLAVYGFFIRLAGDETGALWNGDMLYGFFSGGTIAAAFILAAEPASGAKLRSGVVMAVILGALLSWFFRYKCMDYTGCFIALAVVNFITPLIRLAEEKLFLNRNKKVKAS
jgi:electron transport complex protein RnfD